jgi:hypothetical protein
MHFIDYYVGQIPFPRRILEDFSLQRPLVELGEEVIIRKRTDPNSDITDLKLRIDEQLYKHLSLTDAEIALIEGQTGGAGHGGTADPAPGALMDE